jgi:F0F1-type ATP synthase membrane subunit b/b'
MPQFDFYSFSGQIFWTLFGFYLFYFFVLHFYLTSFSELFKMRQKLATIYVKESNKTAVASNTSLNTFDPILAIQLS